VIELKACVFCGLLTGFTTVVNGEEQPVCFSCDTQGKAQKKQGDK
jgi:hypothetical protein